MKDMDLIEISRPLSFDVGTGTYGVVETIVGLRVRHGRTAPTRTRSRTGVEHKAPSPTQQEFLRLTADTPNGIIATDGRRDENSARALAARGLGIAIRHQRIRARVTGFQINAAGRAAAL